MRDLSKRLRGKDYRQVFPEAAVERIRGRED
jgi:hypothetical protein